VRQRSQGRPSIPSAAKQPPPSFSTSQQPLPLSFRPLPSPSLLFLSLAFLCLSFPPPNSARGSGERCKLASGVWGKRILGSQNAYNGNIFSHLRAMEISVLLICQVKKITQFNFPHFFHESAAPWQGSPKFWAVGKWSENFLLVRKLSSKMQNLGLKIQILGKFRGRVEILSTLSEICCYLSQTATSCLASDDAVARNHMLPVVNGRP